MDELVQSHPEGPNIGFGTILSLIDYLWGHVEWAAKRNILQRLLRAFDGEPEIRDPAGS